jgi:hypothetical protein
VTCEVQKKEKRGGGKKKKGAGTLRPSSWVSHFFDYFLNDIATHGLEEAEGGAGVSAYLRSYETSALKEAVGY